jgi:hypothetical protein
MLSMDVAITSDREDFQSGDGRDRDRGVHSLMIESKVAQFGKKYPVFPGSLLQRKRNGKWPSSEVLSYWPPESLMIELKVEHSGKNYPVFPEPRIAEEMEVGIA